MSARSTTDSHDPFAAIESVGGASAATWLHAGVREAEAGIQDPVLGWVGVRAQVDAGGIHAALVPGSTDAAISLGSQLSGLHTYLAEHHAPIETLTMTAPENNFVGQSLGQANSGGAGHGGAQRDSFTGQGGAGYGASRISLNGRSEVEDGDGGVVAPAVGALLGGTYISVMA